MSFRDISLIPFITLTDALPTEQFSLDGIPIHLSMIGIAFVCDSGAGAGGADEMPALVTDCDTSLSSDSASSGQSDSEPSSDASSDDSADGRAP
jgi:hypothetical protein